MVANRRDKEIFFCSMWREVFEENLCQMITFGKTLILRHFISSHLDKIVLKKRLVSSSPKDGYLTTSVNSVAQANEYAMSQCFWRQNTHMLEITDVIEKAFFDAIKDRTMFILSSHCTYRQWIFALHVPVIIIWKTIGYQIHRASFDFRLQYAVPFCTINSEKWKWKKPFFVLFRIFCNVKSNQEY